MINTTHKTTNKRKCKKGKLPKKHILFHTRTPLTQQQYEVLQKEEVSLGQGKWNTLGFDKVVHQLKALTLTRSFLVYCNASLCQGILKQIENVKFDSLIRLIVNNNNIESMESLCRIDMPMLEVLWIRSNKIIEIKGLRGMKFPHLRSLNLSDNPIQDNQWLTELWLPKCTHLLLSANSNCRWILKTKLWSINVIDGRKEPKVGAVKGQRHVAMIRQTVVQKKAKKKYFGYLKSIQLDD